jgi:uncharacterized protein involved in oxidation of intracellular sulfur
MILTVIVNDSPYGIEKPWNALRFCSTAASEGIEVGVFLTGDSVVSAKKGQNTPQGYYNMEKMLGNLIQKGVQVKVCGACINARGLAIPELVQGVELGSMKILVEWINESNKVISF